MMMMMMMRVLACFLIFMQAIITMVQFVQCQQIPDDGDYNGVNTTQLNDPAVLNVVTEMVYRRLSGVTSQLIHSQIADRASFCVTNPDDDWNRSFNYSDNLSFLSNCILTTRVFKPITDYAQLRKLSYASFDNADELYFTFFS
ncbi:UNVERIFIED_CONTAM: ABC transporter G family member 24 [Sesamum radiatum]|uniref:ABC transporter G family member 24 n=1 Tax=Sesamum radiatum TaxID=300843 RepID=A0AAW2JXH2_SESRA